MNKAEKLWAENQNNGLKDAATLQRREVNGGVGVGLLLLTLHVDISCCQFKNINCYD